jgi:hypothetical protein
MALCDQRRRRGLAVIWLRLRSAAPTPSEPSPVQKNGRFLRVGGFVVGMAAEQGSNLRYRPKAPSSIAYTVTAGKKRYLGGPFRHRRLLGSAA